MPTFLFPLEGVLTWRKLECNLAEARLEQLWVELRRIEDRAAAIEAEREQLGNSFRGKQTFGTEDLRRAAQFNEYARRQKQKLTQARKEYAARIEEQRQAVRDARRRRDLIEKLKERRHKQWQMETDRRQDVLAGEIFLAQQARRLVDPDA